MQWHFTYCITFVPPLLPHHTRGSFLRPLLGYLRCMTEPAAQGCCGFQLPSLFCIYILQSLEFWRAAIIFISIFKQFFWLCFQLVLMCQSVRFLLFWLHNILWQFTHFKTKVPTFFPFFFCEVIKASYFYFRLVPTEHRGDFRVCHLSAQLLSKWNFSALLRLSLLFGFWMSPEVGALNCKVALFARCFTYLTNKLHLFLIQILGGHF